ncbi:DUF1697 domain-containing protein [Streptomyces hoynatensis]|uniref:DUF1697 domain-containing protein n=1 Tax=Streptomyces hoynatensis TaxID=1141874 RepID=A0A3A9YQT5_9ACTN|nr:DUF1697 domain-containing protein [Streptomyces hoynatensis]RKN38315.1 DUF1697 domain-containing protein [Streptomyces hoynatensis]
MDTSEAAGQDQGTAPGRARAARPEAGQSPGRPAAQDGPGAPETTEYVALLRGVNVGGRRMPMAALREVLTGLGHRGVRTWLQSGNAVFTAPAGGRDLLTAELQDALAARFGFRVDCLLLSAAELAATAARCPFPADALDPAKLSVVFLGGPAGAHPLHAAEAAAYAPDEFRLGEREIFAYFPGGMGRSRLGALLATSPPGLLATARNWRTVRALLDLTGRPAPG